ncbi:MAG: hypothetical protein B6I36_09940 [Desulfobacteraceae bacterium 4572_35.1]|nr:MAG: hypothetical protein B6I36_09940 [Desulfobacteraceae bacterium 4572_35.1]
MRQLTLIRHGALDTKLDGCYVGHLDVPLSRVGKNQAVTLAERLVGSNSLCIDTLWCSPALRARQTADPVSNYLDLNYIIKEQLNEINFGRWEGWTFDQMCADDPQRVQQWADLHDNFSFPNGESHQHFSQRITEVTQLILDNEKSNLAIITHGGVIRNLLCELLGFSPRDYLKFTIARGGYATLNLHDKYAELTGLYNDYTCAI